MATYKPGNRGFQGKNEPRQEIMLEPIDDLGMEDDGLMYLWGKLNGYVK